MDFLVDDTDTNVAQLKNKIPRSIGFQVDGDGELYRDYTVDGVPTRRHVHLIPRDLVSRFLAEAFIVFSGPQPSC